MTLKTPRTFTCRMCGQVFTASNYQATLCSDECRRARKREAMRERYRDPDIAAKIRARAMARYRRRRSDPELVEDLRAELRRYSAATRARKRQDPEWVEEERRKQREVARARRQDPETRVAIVERERQKRIRRKALLADREREPYTAAEIYDRDGWVCQICTQPVDPGLTYPHPFSPSVDHVVPITRGGDDTRANVQLAHSRCNIVKGARTNDELTSA